MSKSAFNINHSKLISSSFCLFLLFLLQFSSPVSSIRKDISLQDTNTCRTTVQGRYLIADDMGQVCDALSIDPQSRCCRGKLDRYSCHGCNLVSQCCNSYEFCVSCCLNPSRTQKNLALNVKISKPITAGTYSSIFDFCTGRCRHNSESVVHENAYLSEFHHCFSIPFNSSSSDSNVQTEVRLAGINIVIGTRGESCDTVSKSSGQSCVPNKFQLLNQCEMMHKYLSCKGGCLSSVGADQPAEVVDDAPRDLNPGACLYTSQVNMLSCDGSHQHTKRLCPCA
ncbi:putative tetrapyrrole-binding protein, chloroplastic [Capsicum annuum]|nr:putative tetrapyrrole-binding protein, chloroplastic [Capsicum annuum]